MTADASASDQDSAEFVLVAVIKYPAAPEAFTLVAYPPGNRDLGATQYPNSDIRLLDPKLLTPGARDEVRLALDIVRSSGNAPDGVVVGTTDGRGGWTSWDLSLFAKTPGPPPRLPDTGQ